MTDTLTPQSEPPASPTNYWRIATVICLIMLAIAAATGMSMMAQFKAQMTHMQGKLKSLPHVKYIALLQDEQHLPAQLITFDPQDGYAQIQRLNDVKEGREQSLQLWALDDSGRPLSLGVLTPKLQTAQIPVTDKILSQARKLVISVETKGGIEPDQPPRQPYLFEGLVIQKAQ